MHCNLLPCTGRLEEGVKRAATVGKGGKEGGVGETSGGKTVLTEERTEQKEKRKKEKRDQWRHWKDPQPSDDRSARPRGLRFLHHGTGDHSHRSWGRSGGVPMLGGCAFS